MKKIAPGHLMSCHKEMTSWGPVTLSSDRLPTLSVLIFAIRIGL